MNRPEAEPELCDYLLHHGIPVSEFIRSKEDRYVVSFDQKIAHLQKYVDGKNFQMNEAPDWFMSKVPVILGKIHQALNSYPELPRGL